MKIKDFMKDKFVHFLLIVLLYGMLAFLLLGFRVNISLFIAITILYWGMLTSMFAYEYYRKKNFYDLLRKQLNELDQMYLLHAMLYKPSFYDGKVLYEALYQSNKAMKEKINAYQESMEDFKEYIELWIHEIKIPLASGLLTLHNHHFPNNDKLVQSFQKMDDYMEQILYYIRSENPEKDYFIKKINLKTVINAVMIRNKDSFIDKKIKLVLNDLDVEVYSDTKWLGFMINQIVQNSIKYCDKTESVITISTKKEDGVTKLIISDNGIGIATADINRVFEKGFTGMNGRKISHSTGMGLYICKRLCDKLGHTITVTSKINQKTSVAITFPLNTYYDVLD